MKPQRYVAFLRGINLGKRRVQMSRLAELFEAMRFQEVRTFIASGNVIFQSQSAGRTDAADLEKTIGAHLAANLGYEVSTFVRTAEEVAAVARLPVFEEDGQDAITVHVAFLREPLERKAAAMLESVANGYDRFRVIGREFYWLCRGRMSDSVIWETPEVKALKLPVNTMRNIGSVRKLVARHFPELAET